MRTGEESIDDVNLPAVEKVEGPNKARSVQEMSHSERAFGFDRICGFGPSCELRVTQ